MPLYTFYNKRSKKEFTEMMTISEMESYLKKNKHISQRITGINIVAGVSGMSYRSDQGWKEPLSKVAEAHPRSPLADRYGKKSIKEIKTNQAIKKHPTTLKIYEKKLHEENILNLKEANSIQKNFNDRIKNSIDNIVKEETFSNTIVNSIDDNIEEKMLEAPCPSCSAGVPTEGAEV